MASQRLTITGSAAAGYTWTCGTCGQSGAKTQATRVLALAAYDIHYSTSPSIAVDSWWMALMTAGAALAAASSADPAMSAAWTTALNSAPPGIVATWQNAGVTHPQ